MTKKEAENAKQKEEDMKKEALKQRNENGFIGNNETFKVN